MSFNDLEQGFDTNGSPTISALTVSDDDKQFKQLTQRIAQQIFHINERLVNLLGGNRDTSEIRGNLHDVTNATRELIKDSTQDLKSLSLHQSLDSKKSRQRRLEQQKLSRDFQTVLNSFQKVQRESAAKQREYVNKAKATTVMLQSQVDEEEQENQRVLAVDSQRQVQLEALDSEIEYNELLISEREGEIQNIEQGISELNEIFRDMGMLVNEQESGIRKYTNKKEKF
ncbi:hypothetical protein MFLAVUS_005095 [Mucor flavus]|uniref:t-SNARE coiled-coil homology domain-containing protein n=1 Tax=Mucor flavus TaxID=439312 RepID=A0ABP9YXU2_9FUNG